MPPHHSYKEFYDAKVPEKLPFNQTPPRLAGEKSDFVSLPVKCNSPMQRNKKEFTLSDLYRDPRKAVPIDDDSCLSFEKAIRKYMSNTVVEEEMKSTLNCNEPISSGTHTIPGTGIPRIEDSPMLGHFPSSSQWTILDQLRIHAGSPERSENGIAMLIDYLAQLQYLESKFPFDTGKLNIVFVWYSAFFDEVQDSTTCIQFEKASVWFNIAAIYSQIASQTRLSGPDGKKKASMSFQKAAGILIRIRDSYCHKLKANISKNSELNENNLSAMATLMLAQAAECFYEKATEDYCTSQATAIVAVYVADLYETALRYVTDPVFSCFEQRFPKTFKTHMKSKLHLYGAIANFHTPVNSTSERAVAERLARLQRVKEHITLSLGYAQELGGLTLTIVQVSSIYKSYAEVYTAAFDCTDSANSAIHHHTPYDEKLLAPLRRPTEALVNPIGSEELLTLISTKPDILSGLLSPTNRAELQKIKSESEKLANDGQQKIKLILESCQKYIVLIRTIPNIGEFPISEHSSRNYCDVQSKAFDLIKEMQSYQKDEYLLSNKELIGCLQKLQKYSEEDLRHAKRCVSQLVPLITESSDPIKYNKLKALMSAIKLLSGDVFQQHFEQIGSLTAQYEGKISDIEVNLGNQETMKSLYTISEIDLRFESLKNSWTKISNAIKIKSSKIQQVYNEGLKLSLELKELVGDNCFENNEHQLVKIIANKKIQLISLENKLKEISSRFESIMGSLAQEYKSSKNILSMIGNLQSYGSQIQELTQSLIAVRGFRKLVIKAIQKSIEIRHESCILLSSTLKLDGPRAKDSLDHGVNFSDPYLVLMLNQQELEPIPQFKEPVNLNSLIRTLTDLYILPLDHEVSRQESLQRLAEEMQIRSNPVELELDRNIGSLNDLFVEMQNPPAAALPNQASSPAGIVHGISQLFKWARQSSKKDLNSDLRAQKSTGNIVDSVDNPKLNDVIQENSLLKGKLSIAQQKISSRERQISSMQEKIHKLHESVQRQPKTPIIEKLKSYLDIARIDSSDEAVINPSTQTTNAIPNLSGSSPKDINIKKIFGRAQQKLIPKKGIVSIKKENEDIAKMLLDFN